MSYDEITIACENVIIDEVVTLPTTRDRQIDTRVPMEIGMAARDDGEHVGEEGRQRIVDLALQAVYKEEAKENEVWKGSELE